MLNSSRTGRAAASAGRRPITRATAASPRSDPDGNGWLLQEITTRLPGRGDRDVTTFASTDDMASALWLGRSVDLRYHTHGTEPVEGPRARSPALLGAVRRELTKEPAPKRPSSLLRTRKRVGASDRRSRLR